MSDKKSILFPNEPSDLWASSSGVRYRISHFPNALQALNNACRVFFGGGTAQQFHVEYYSAFLYLPVMTKHDVLQI
ncbi:MAG: hypothetical protein Q7T62_04525 [Undibacterium sp.]|nr:hypothetical protein [Undibacterium sp.]